MTADNEQLRAARRADLRAQLQAQRRLIAQQLGPEGRGSDGYPRSRTMRLLTARPDVAIGLLGGLSSLFRRR